MAVEEGRVVNQCYFVSPLDATTLADSCSAVGNEQISDLIDTFFATDVFHAVIQKDAVSVALPDIIMPSWLTASQAPHGLAVSNEVNGGDQTSRNSADVLTLNDHMHTSTDEECTHLVTVELSSCDSSSDDEGIGGCQNSQLPDISSKRLKLDDSNITGENELGKSDCTSQEPNGPPSQKSIEEPVALDRTPPSAVSKSETISEVRATSTIKCPICKNTRLSSIQRLRTHAQSKHKILPDSAGMVLFVEAAENVKCGGWRVSTTHFVKSFLGSYANDPNLCRLVFDLLYELNVVLSHEDKLQSFLAEKKNRRQNELLRLIECSKSTSLGAQSDDSILYSREEDELGVQHDLDSAPIVRVESLELANRAERFKVTGKSNKLCQLNALRFAGKKVNADKEISESNDRNIPGRGSRKETINALHSSVLTPSFSGVKLCQLASLYVETCTEAPLVSRKKASVVRTGQIVHRFVDYCKKANPDESSEWKLVVSVNLVDHFVAALQTVFRPITVKNHAIEMLRFLREVGGISKLLGLVPHGLRPARLSAIEKWQRTAKQLEKVGRDFQKKRIMSGQFSGVSFLVIFQYLRDQSIRERVECAFSDLEDLIVSVKAEDGEESVIRQLPGQYSDDWLLITRFLAVTLLAQGQRLCVLQNMKLSEFDAAHQIGAFTVYRVGDHKTSSTYGPAAFVLGPRERKDWERYRKIRASVCGGPENDSYLLLNGCGMRVTSSLLEDLNRYISRKVPQFQGPEVSHTLVRKTIETLGQLFLGDVDKIMAGHCTELLESFLCHSGKVTNIHYRFRTDEVVLNQFRVVDGIVKQSVALEVMNLKSQLIFPSDLFGKLFPSKTELLAKLQNVCPEFSLDLHELSPYAYRKARDTWTNEKFQDLLQKLRSEFANHFATLEPSEDSLVERVKSWLNAMLGEVWNAHKLDLLDLLVQDVNK